MNKAGGGCRPGKMLGELESWKDAGRPGEGLCSPAGQQAGCWLMWSRSTKSTWRLFLRGGEGHSYWKLIGHTFLIVKWFLSILGSLSWGERSLPFMVKWENDEEKLITWKTYSEPLLFTPKTLLHIPDCGGTEICYRFFKRFCFPEKHFSLSLQ